MEEKGGMNEPNAIPADDKTVRLRTGTAFPFKLECRSESQRNGVRPQTGIAFAFEQGWDFLSIPAIVTLAQSLQSLEVIHGLKKLTVIVCFRLVFSHLSNV